MKSSNSHLWKTAMEEELASMTKTQCGLLVDNAENLKFMGCKWIFKTTHDSQGNIDKYKARLVAKGFTQRE